MQINEYQEKAVETAIYGVGSKINYPVLGLVGEAGEIANKYKKVLRDTNGNMSAEQKAALSDELGDVLWYCAALARDLDATLEEVCQANLEKLAKRRLNNTIHGSGDNR
jgi:NTP pyrophosphatase (non-canonical NTP hydrolase)